MNNVVNVLDIGVINDGKTDCSKIINDFLNNIDNYNKELYFPHGKYYFKDTIKVNNNFNSIKFEEGSFIQSNENTAIYVIPKMTEYDIKMSLIRFYNNYLENYRSELEEYVKKILNKMYKEDNSSIDRLISSLLYDNFLSEDKINDGYGIKDAKEFLDWFWYFISSN